MKTPHKFFLGLLLITLALLPLIRSAIKAQSSKTQVMVMKIRAEIDPRMSRYIKLAFSEAEAQKTDIVIIDMDTYGGRVDNADEITSKILAYKKPVWVFVNNNAASAGAWISIACDSIYMADGSSIGAATVVMGEGEAAPDKYQSYMRGKMRATAAAKGRNPRIAEAMVDQRLEVPGVSEAGQVITFSTDEAIKNNYCEAKVKSIEEILKRNNVKDYQIKTYELNSVEQFISFFLNPYLSGILLLIIIGGIYFELQTPGVGFPIFAALIAGILYFVPYYLNGLAENWELALFAVGILLLLLEAVVIPGFGVPGILGLVITFGALLLMMISNNSFDFTLVPQAEIYGAFMGVTIGIVGGILFIIFALPKIMSSERFKSISLQYTQRRDEGYHSSSYTADLVGRIATTHTVLRPSGKIDIDDKLYDAYSLGDFIDQGVKVVVISFEGTSLRVKEYHEETF